MPPTSPLNILNSLRVFKSWCGFRIVRLALNSTGDTFSHPLVILLCKKQFFSISHWNALVNSCIFFFFSYSTWMEIFIGKINSKHNWIWMQRICVAFWNMNDYCVCDVIVDETWFECFKRLLFYFRL